MVLQIHLDARLLPVGSANIGFSAVPYTITYDPNIRDSMYIELHQIPARDTVNVQVTIQMESRAELFDRCLWQADLYLRDKLIEYNHEKIRVSPFYIPRDPAADVLMVTDSQITRKEFVFWQRILETMRVTVDFWDTVRYGGFSVDSRTNTRHQVTWEGRYPGRMILYPHCDIRMALGIDIVRHFHGQNYRDGPLEDLNSSIVLFMPPSQPHLPQASPFYDHGDLAILRHLSAVEGTLEIPENAYSGLHIFRPGSCGVSSQPYLKWEKNWLKKLEKEVPSQAANVIARQVAIQSAGIFRYSYGAVDLRRFPLLRSCKFVVMDGAGGSMMDISLDDINLTPSSTEIPLASNFGQVLLATLFGIPLRCKLAVIKTQSEVTEEPLINFSFYLPNGFAMTIHELVIVCIAAEVADEVYNCSGVSHRMSELAQDVQNNMAAYLDNGRAVVQGMELIKEEVKL